MRAQNGWKMFSRQNDERRSFLSTSGEREGSLNDGLTVFRIMCCVETNSVKRRVPTMYDFSRLETFSIETNFNNKVKL